MKLEKYQNVRGALSFLFNPETLTLGSCSFYFVDSLILTTSSISIKKLCARFSYCHQLHESGLCTALVYMEKIHVEFKCASDGFKATFRTFSYFSFFSLLFSLWTLVMKSYPNSFFPHLNKRQECPECPVCFNCQLPTNNCANGGVCDPSGACLCPAGWGNI